MELLLPIARLCLEYAVRRRLAPQRPGIAAMAERAAREVLGEDPLRLRYSSRGWLTVYWLTEEFTAAATAESRKVLANFEGFDEVLELFKELLRGSEACADAESLVNQAVQLYKKVYTKHFAPTTARISTPGARRRRTSCGRGRPPSPTRRTCRSRRRRSWS